MSCPSLLRRRPEAAEIVGDASDRPIPGARELADVVVAWLRRDDGWAQFARFVLVGGSSTGVYAVLFLALQGFGTMVAHLLATVASTILANELHRRLTFHAEDRVGWLVAQIEAGGVSLLGLVATSTALGWLNTSVDSAPPILQISLVVAVTAFIGLMRFIALRWIFRPQVTEPA